MSRTDQRRRRVLRAVAPVAGLLAVGLLVWQGSYAAFSATTSNGANSWASGTLTLTNDGGTGVYGAAVPYNSAALFNELAIKPGDTKDRCLTVKAGGTAGGNLVFYRNGASTGSPALAAQIGLTITRSAVTAVDPAIPAACTGFVGGTVIASNVGLSALNSTYGTGYGSVAVPAGTQYVVYKLNYVFNSLGAGLDNPLQGLTTGGSFQWEIQ
jgi:hypothetical protein